MIAVVGCAKQAVRIVMRPPDEENGMAAGAIEPAAIEPKEDEKMLVESGGCGANIALHLAEMGYETQFISAVGSDAMGAALMHRLEKAGVKTDGVKEVPQTTAVDVDFLNVLGDLEFSRRNSTVIKNITPEFLKERSDILDSADIIVIDGTLPRESIEYMAEKYGGRDDVKLFYDPAMMHGGYKAREVIGSFYGMMPGRMESEAITKKNVLSEDQMMEAGAFLHEKGVTRIIITIKGGGLYYKEGMNEGILRPERMLSFGDTSGAGDVVSAAVIAGTAEGHDIETVAKAAMQKAAEFLADRKDERLA